MHISADRSEPGCVFSTDPWKSRPIRAAFKLILRVTAFGTKEPKVSNVELIWRTIDAPPLIPSRWGEINCTEEKKHNKLCSQCSHQLGGQSESQSEILLVRQQAANQELVWGARVVPPGSARPGRRCRLQVQSLSQQTSSVLMALLLDEFVFILSKTNTRGGKTIRHRRLSGPLSLSRPLLVKWLQFLTKASCRPMFPIVITPAKKMQGNQERMYRKSGDVYLCRGEETHDSNMSNNNRAQQRRLPEHLGREHPATDWITASSGAEDGSDEGENSLPSHLCTHQKMAAGKDVWASVKASICLLLRFYNTVLVLIHV